MSKKTLPASNVNKTTYWCSTKIQTLKKWWLRYNPYINKWKRKNLNIKKKKHKNRFFSHETVKPHPLDSESKRTELTREKWFRWSLVDHTHTFEMYSIFTLGITKQIFCILPLLIIKGAWWTMLKTWPSNDYDWALFVSASKITDNSTQEVLSMGWINHASSVSRTFGLIHLSKILSIRSLSLKMNENQ